MDLATADHSGQLGDQSLKVHEPQKRTHGLPWSNEAFLCQLHCESPCDAFQFLHGILSRIDFDPCLGPTKRNIHYCTLRVVGKNKLAIYIYQEFITIRVCKTYLTGSLSSLRIHRQSQFYTSIVTCIHAVFTQPMYTCF